MPRASTKEREVKEKGERSSKLRPGRIRQANTPPPRVTGTAKNLLRPRLHSAGCPPLKNRRLSSAAAL
jgi:hypothetical protein